MGEEFWEDNYNSILTAGTKLQMSNDKVNEIISCYMVSIYKALGQFEMAYEFLIHQANSCSWLTLYSVQSVVSKIHYGIRLHKAICQRLIKNDLKEEDRKDFLEIKKWLEDNNYC